MTNAGPVDRDGARLLEAWQLSRTLIAVAEASKQNFAETVAELGLPVHLARALTMLDEPAPMSELADALACDRSYVTSLADQLEERGLAVRAPGVDRRIKLLELTEAGRALRDEVARAVSTSGLVLTRLDDAQRATLQPLLAALLDERDAD